MDFANLASKLLKQSDIRQELKQLIGKEVTVYIDRPKGTKHPVYQDMIYPINYGYIKEITTTDEEYQDVYLLGVDYPIDKCNGKVYAVVIRENDIEDKLIVTTDDKDYTVDEIEKIIDFQEKYFKYRIIK